jgi:hypothetical protein
LLLCSKKKLGYSIKKRKKKRKKIKRKRKRKRKRTNVPLRNKKRFRSPSFPQILQVF